jgi:hypothetical protein
MVYRSFSRNTYIALCLFPGGIRISGARNRETFQGLPPMTPVGIATY